MPEPQSHTISTRTRVIAFAVVLLLCLLGGGAYVVVAASSDTETATNVRVAQVATARGVPATVSGRRVLVRAADSDDPGLDGRLTVTRLGGGAPRETDLACQRVYMNGGRGLCLALAGTGIDYTAVIFDRRFRAVESLALDGLPSRARVSADGRLGAVTSFVTGHSYADSGEFSTSTRLIDLRRGRWLSNLEDFTVFQNGRRLEAPDFNFWGVTFEHGGRGFYATLSTGAHRYLVHGDLARRRVDVMRDFVECPSLSPDGKRIAYKRTLGNGRWRSHVLELATGKDRALAETRSIDDQIEWLDDRFVAYGDGEDVFVTRADGTGKPEKLLLGADSPVSLG